MVEEPTMEYWIRYIYIYISCKAIINYSAVWYYSLAFAHLNVRGLKPDYWARMEGRKKNPYIID